MTSVYSSICMSGIMCPIYFLLRQRHVTESFSVMGLLWSMFFTASLTQKITLVDIGLVKICDIKLVWRKVATSAWCSVETLGSLF